MKTWEMIKELTENPSKKFMCKSGPRKGRTVGFDGRSIDWHDEYRTNEFEKSYFSIKSTLNWEWEEVKEPVSFIDVLRSGKKVMIKHQDIDGELSYMSETYNEIDDVMYNISNYFTAEGVREILLNGEWYIED